MSKRIVIGMIVAAAAMTAVVLALMGWWRVRDAAMLSRPYAVKTPGGTNCVWRIRTHSNWCWIGGILFLWMKRKNITGRP